MHGAGGGVGLAAVEIGKMLGDRDRNRLERRKLAIAKARGADHLVRYDQELSSMPSSASPTGRARTWYSIRRRRGVRELDALHQLGRGSDHIVFTGGMG